MRLDSAATAWVACTILIAISCPVSANSEPQVTNVTAEQRTGTGLVDIYYDLYDADGDLMVVTAVCLVGGGNSVPVTTTQQGSDIGPGTASGLGKHIVWDVGVDMPGHAGADYVVRVTACDPGIPSDMLLVPAGVFTMGDGVASCGTNQHQVTLTRAFHLGQHEVTNHEYMEALQWAYDRGYVAATTALVRDNLDGNNQTLLNLGSPYCEIRFSDATHTFSLRQSPSSEAQNAYPEGYDPAYHPVKTVTWHGAARYCDWLSLREGLPRAYEYCGGNSWSCNNGDPYGAAGYRLPTDAEWEYAAQYDDERIYPWGDEATNCSRANYSGCVGWTSPVGSRPGGDSQVGFSDLAGNLWEWCNDWQVCDLGTAPVTDPVGPSSGSTRGVRGSSWEQASTSYQRCANRYMNYTPGTERNYLGFRVARTANP